MCGRFSRVIALLLVLSLAAGAWADLVGHWKLDEGSGTVAKDATKNGNNGTLEGVPLWVAGQLGGALQFDGNDRVNCGDASQLALTQTLSITLWVSPGDLAGDHAFAGRSAANVGYAFKSYANHLRFTTPGVRDHDGANSILQLNTWQHVAITFAANQATGCVFYINGVATDTLSASNLVAGAGPFEIGHNHWAQWCTGMIDDVRVYDHALTVEEVAAAMKGEGPGAALDPNPADEATDVLADSALAWTAGEFAATHDVYLGTSFADVNDASRANPGAVLVSQGQTDAQYDPDGLLAYGQTYYWRIDEVNAAPDNTIFKGPVWSFTAEPFAYPLTGITATASSAQPGMGAQNAVNGSGLNANDQHSVEATQMWMTNGTKPAWIQFEFAKVEKLHEMWVWNSNQMIEAFIGFGAKNVTIEYSTDGTTWTTLANVPEFAKATAAATYTSNTVVPFGGVQAKYVKLTVNANWGGVAPQTGLAEVRFFQVPVQARAPVPADAATGVGLDAELNWRPGREAASHKVYFSEDQAAVADGSASAATVTDHRYTPDPMNLGATCYWRVDEAGDGGTYPGDVWSFTVQNFKVVDDMESYTDEEGGRIYESWTDGVTTGQSGSQVGYMQAPFAEKTILHGGAQSLPMTYNNTGTAIAEAALTLDQDWTTNGVKSLSLYFRGAAGNTGQLYIKINNAKVLYDGPAGDIAALQWLPWNIDLSAVATNLKKVTSLTVGVEGAGAAGILYVDDICLYPRAPEFVVPTQPASTGLVAQYKFEGDLKDSIGSNHGAAFGDAKVTGDPVRGQVLSVDGNGDKVDIPYNAALNPETFTVSLWAWPDSAGTDYRSPLTSRHEPPQSGYILYITPANMWEFWTGTGTTWHGTRGCEATMDEWCQVTATYVGGLKTLYVNGRQVGQNNSVMVLNAQRPLRIGGGATEGDGNYFFRGLIDDVRIYNRVLSAEEVAGLAGQTKPLPKPF
jgi:hypothetical protein